MYMHIDVKYMQIHIFLVLVLAYARQCVSVEEYPDMQHDERKKRRVKKELCENIIHGMRSL